MGGLTPTVWQCHFKLLTSVTNTVGCHIFASYSTSLVFLMKDNIVVSQRTCSRAYSILCTSTLYNVHKHVNNHIYILWTWTLYNIYKFYYIFGQHKDNREHVHKHVNEHVHEHVQEQIH